MQRVSLEELIGVFSSCVTTIRGVATLGCVVLVLGVGFEGPGSSSWAGRGSGAQTSPRNSASSLSGEAEPNLLAHEMVEGEYPLGLGWFLFGNLFNEN